MNRIRQTFSNAAESPATPVVVGLVIVALVVITILVLYRLVVPRVGPQDHPELQMAFVIVGAVAILLILLFAIAVAFSRVGLTDANEALGLPKGSVRALIALILIMIFAITSIHLFRTVGTGDQSEPLPGLTAEQVLQLNPNFIARIIRVDPPEGQTDATYTVIYRVTMNEDGVRLAQQLLTTLATLVVAVAAFYFGTSSVRAGSEAALAARGGDTPSGTLAVKDITPTQGASNSSEVAIIVTGAGFTDDVDVSLRLSGQKDIPSTKRDVSASQTICIFDLTGATPGLWDVVISTPGGTEVIKKSAFKVT